MPDKSNNVYILMGNFKTKIKADKLAGFDPTIQKIAEKIKPIMSSSESFTLRKRDLSPTLDLRGIKVEDGLDELENYLDKASLANLTPVTIIHGHGTGAMKSAVRTYLAESPYVKEFHPGGETDGGDGVSIVDLK